MEDVKLIAVFFPCGFGFGFWVCGWMGMGMGMDGDMVTSQLSAL